MVNPCGKKTGVGVKLSRSLVASGFWPHRLYYYYHLYIFIYTFRIYIYIYRVFIYIHLSCDKSIYLKYTGVRVWVASYEKCSWSHVVFTLFFLVTCLYRVTLRPRFGHSILSLSLSRQSRQYRDLRPSPSRHFLKLPPSQPCFVLRVC